jgi:hypothetical protein
MMIAITYDKIWLNIYDIAQRLYILQAAINI